jgi:hypothetical protein
MPEMNHLRAESPMIERSAAAALLLTPPMLAQEARPAGRHDLARASKPGRPTGCRAYVVVSNPSTTSFDAYKLDLVMFQADGIIGRRFAVDLAPLRPSKRTVKLFELDGTSCDGIGSFLVNDVMECRSDAGPVNDCLARLQVKSLTKVEISK